MANYLNNSDVGLEAIEKGLDNDLAAIESLAGRRMPYGDPGALFFEDLSCSVLRLISERAELTLFKRVAATMVAAAASVALLCGVYFSGTSAVDGVWGSSDLSEYINDLSDEDLLNLFYASEFEDSFYSSL